MSKLIKALAVVLFFAVIFPACAPDNAPNEKGYSATTIRFAENEAYLGTFSKLMERTGFLGQALPEDVTAEFVYISSNNVAVEALATDNLDFAQLAMAAVISSIENDLPVVPLSGTTYGTAKIYSNRANILSMDDVGPEDKIAIMILGNHLDLAQMLYAKEEYGDYYKFSGNMQTMSNEDALISLASSDTLAGAVLGFPQTIQAEQIEGIQEIQDLTPYMRKYGMSGVLVTTQKFNRENPVLAEAVNKAAKETVDWAVANPREAADILAEIMGGVSADDILSLISDAPMQHEISESAYDTVANLMYEIRVIPNLPKKFSELPNYDSIPKIA